MKKEEEILRKEEKILNELEQEKKDLKSLKKNQNILNLLILVTVAGVLGGGIYWQISSGRVYIEKSQILGDEVSLSPQTNGVLMENFVKEGDYVGENAPVARVGNELVTSKVAGVVISVR
ncbi:MAG TPA: hypothetical protein P5056_00175, partial [Candidatus Paceibacterota bacterium]|nr:hypothetical protein [Candidatus Paceibacterota bacterium]